MKVLTAQGIPVTVVSCGLVGHALVGTRSVVQIVLWVPEQYVLVSGISRLLVVLPHGAGLITWSNPGFWVLPYPVNTTIN